MLVGPISTNVLEPWLGGQSAPPGRGGVSVSRLADGLLSLGHRVTIATNDPTLPHAGDHVTVSEGDLTIHFGPYRPSGRARDAFRVEREFATRMTASVPADVAHAHWTYEEALGAMAARADVVVTARDWGPAILRHHPHPYRVVRLGMQVRALRKAAALTVPSPYMQRLVGRVAAVPVEVVPNAISEATFGPADRRPRTGGAPSLVAVNVGWGHRKNVSTLVSALPLIRRAVPGTTLRLFGTDHEPGGLAQVWAAERGLLEGVSFEGQQPMDRVLTAMREADVFVHPAREESFGNVLVEAMAQGTPVVAGAGSGAVPWVMGDAGVLVDVEQAPEVARGVLRLLEDPALWTDRSAAGRQRAWDEFRIESVTRRYLAVYRELA